MNKSMKRFLGEFLGFVLLIMFDQLTKGMAVNLLKDKGSCQIIDGVLELYYLPNGNTGAAFGILKGHQLLFVVMALIVVAIIGYILFNMPYDRKYLFISILLVFVAAGGIGNLIDRIRQNFVVDFIYFSLINFPVFNVADIYVTVSVCILAVYIIFIMKEEDYKVMEQSILAPFNKNKKS